MKVKFKKKSRRKQISLCEELVEQLPEQVVASAAHFYFTHSLRVFVVLLFVSTPVVFSVNIVFCAPNDSLSRCGFSDFCRS